MEEGKELETGRELSSPSVSIEDRTVVGPADHI